MKTLTDLSQIKSLLKSGDDANCRAGGERASCEGGGVQRSGGPSRAKVEVTKMDEEPKMNQEVLVKPRPRPSVALPSAINGRGRLRPVRNHGGFAKTSQDTGATKVLKRFARRFTKAVFAMAIWAVVCVIADFYVPVRRISIYYGRPMDTEQPVSVEVIPNLYVYWFCIGAVFVVCSLGVGFCRSVGEWVKRRRDARYKKVANGEVGNVRL